MGTSTYSYFSARSDMDEIVKAKAELGQAREAQLSCLHPDLAKLETWAHQLRVVLSEVREKYHARYHNELEKDIGFGVDNRQEELHPTQNINEPQKKTQANHEGPPASILPRVPQEEDERTF